MDDEVARHLEELQRIAVKIQAEAHWTAERDYFRPESRAASAASTAGSQRSGRHSVRSEPRVERSARSDTRAEREHAYTDHPQKQYQAYKPMQPPRAFTTGTTSAHPPNGLAMTTGSGPAARKRQPIKPKSNWVPPANWDAKRVA